METWLSQLGAGTKHLTERIAEYPIHDQQPYYPYEPSSSHGHGTSSKHHYGGGHKSNAAMSALTLLAFLFFLHILQQCLKEHMTAMTTPQVMVVSAGREGEPLMSKTNNKLDKSGLVQSSSGIQNGGNVKTKIGNDTTSSSADSEMLLMRVATEEHTPKESKNKLVRYNKSITFDGFVNAMDKN